jgi:hypothetical protein
MVALQHTSSLICPACGRHGSAADADLEGTTASASCPSCGTLMVRAPSTAEGADTAATQRISAPDIVEEATAILAPPSGAASPAASASTHRETLEQSRGSAPPDLDRYQTASATQPVNADVVSGPAQDLQMLPIGEPFTAPEDQPQRDGWRNPWLIGSAVLVLLFLFVGGILLSQAPGHAVTSVPQVTPAPSATSTATSILPPGYTRVEDSSGLYSIAVPGSWVPVKKSSTNAEYTIYTDPSHGVTFEVESFPTGNGQTGAALDNIVLMDSFPAHSVSNISGPVPTSLAGVTWTKETAILALQQNGTTEQNSLTVQTTSYNGTTFIIFYSSPVASNADTNAEALPSVLRSFTFLG